MILVPSVGYIDYDLYKSLSGSTLVEIQDKSLNTAIVLSIDELRAILAEAVKEQG